MWIKSRPPATQRLETTAFSVTPRSCEITPAAYEQDRRWPKSRIRGPKVAVSLWTSAEVLCKQHAGLQKPSASIRAKWTLCIITALQKAKTAYYYNARSQNFETRLTASSCLSVHLSARNNSALTGQISIKYHIWRLFENLPRKLQFY
jgi:hypothetical protein